MRLVIAVVALKKTSVPFCDSRMFCMEEDGQKWRGCHMRLAHRTYFTLKTYKSKMQ